MERSSRPPAGPETPRAGAETAARAGEAAPRAGAEAAAPVGEAASAARPRAFPFELLKLPQEWQALSTKGSNVPNAKSDFADVKRHCNRTLQRMYSQWQAELAAARQEERVFVQTGQSNLLATNQLLASEKREHEALKGRHEMLKQELQRLQNDYKKTKTDLQGQNSELQSKLDKQEAELKAKHESEMAKVNMEAASKLLAETSKLTAAQTELEQQTKLLKEATDEAARIKARSKAKSGEMRHDYVRFRAKVATAVAAWRHRTNSLKRRLDSANLRLELFKACALQKF